MDHKTIRYATKAYISYDERVKGPDVYVMINCTMKCRSNSFDVGDKFEQISVLYGDNSLNDNGVYFETHNGNLLFKLPIENIFMWQTPTI